MNRLLESITAPLLLIAISATGSTYYEELTPGFSRIKSNAMVRTIGHPTLAALDYAAYIDNPVLYEPGKFKPRTPEQPVKITDAVFDGLLQSPVAAPEKMPLSAEERNHPLAWRPLVKRLWDVVKTPGFSIITAKINGHKWADSSVGGAYQEISAIWLHRDGDRDELWAEIELSPWVRFIADAADVDNDGIKELFGRIDCASIPEATLDSAVAWVRSDYTQRTLSCDEIIDWVTELASYWYPAKNTDILDWEGVWPGKTTEGDVRRTMRNVKVSDPVAVVRGRPFGKPVYNVYIVDSVHADAPSVRTFTASVSTPSKMKNRSGPDSTLIFSIWNAADELAAEARRHGGYDQWALATAPFITAQQKFLSALPAAQMGYEGRNDWLFFRKDLEYGIAGDLGKQPYEKNPLTHLAELKKYLDKKGVDLLFVPVPNKTEVYFDQLPFGPPADVTSIVNPYSRKILADLAAAGIETIDLLPQFLSAKKTDATHAGPLYQKQDTHWTAAGLMIAADCIARRIEAFGWYPDYAKNRVSFTVRDTTTSRLGDIVDRLPESKRAVYAPAPLAAHRVYLPDGSPFKSDKNAPIILMGDSFTGVFETVDCKSSGIGANIAAKTGIPVDIITSWGGGPMVRERLVRQRGDDLGAKRLVIYMMVARDLYNYEQSWTPLCDILSK